jgi:hypothetical protein
MKKIIFLLGIMFLTNSAFAQESWEYNRRSAITINPGAFIVGTVTDGFGIGIAFEHSFTPQFSTKANAYFLEHEARKGFYPPVSRVEGHTIMGMFAVEGRWYPLARYLEGVFINGGFQYHLIGGTVAFHDYNDEIDRQFRRTFSTASLFTGLGYKVVFGKNRFGLALEPTIDYIWPFYTNLPYSHRDDIMDHSGLSVTAMGIKGIRFGFQIGAAF